MKYLFKLFLALFCLTFIFGCSRISEKAEIAADNKETNAESVLTNKGFPEKSELNTNVDVIRLANQSTFILDNEFGQPLKITPIKDNPKLMPGEFREYAVKGHPKNLSVRFYKDKAKRFNLLLGTPEKSSKNALMEIFKIDVGKMRQIKTDTLSETWSGKFEEINLKTAYAKRSKAGGDFVMLHAEVE